MSMEATAVQSAALAGSVNADMSIWGLFLQADFVVKAVMIGLLLASFWCWAIIFEKVRLYVVRHHPHENLQRKPSYSISLGKIGKTLW